MEPTPAPFKPVKPESNRKLTVSFDSRLIIGLLLIVIAGMLAFWQPWKGTRQANDRTIQVTGQTIVKAEPDEYQFSPSYEFKNADKNAANKAANDKSTEVVAGLKKLGIDDKNIKTAINSYNGDYRPDGTYNKDNYTYTLSVTASVNAKDKSQTVQDYLNTTSPQGIITPFATFSEAKRKQVEASARDEATKDARAKAEQSAKNLGFKLGNVKDVVDGQGFGVMPLANAADMPASVASGTSGPEYSKITSSTVMPGQNDLAYSVTVTYYLR